MNRGSRVEIFQVQAHAFRSTTSLRLSLVSSCLRRQQSLAQGHVSCAMPVTFMVLIVIFESGMFGSMGAVASIMTIPLKPEH